MSEIEKLQEAINHCKEVEDGCKDNEACRLDHKQLRMWLTELLGHKLTQEGYIQFKCPCCGKQTQSKREVKVTNLGG